MRTVGHSSPSRRLALSLGVSSLAIVLLAPMATAAKPKTKLASQSSAEVQAMGGASHSPDTSATGRFVVYRSEASNLIAGDDNGTTDVFIRDFKSGTTKLVSAALDGGVGDDFSSDPSVSANGRFIAFSSGATDLIAGGTDGTTHIFVRDRFKDTTELISRSSAGTHGNGGSNDGAISADRRWVAFESNADNLVGKDTKGVKQIYLFDRDKDKLILVSRNTAGEAGNAKSEEPAISGNGRYVVYESASTNLTGKDTKGKRQVFLFDKRKKRTELISKNNKGKAGNDLSLDAAISADGAKVVYRSRATNLGKDTNGFTDAYLRNRRTGRTSRVSLNWKGRQLNGGAVDSLGADISANGRWVAFASSATNATKGSTHSGLYGHIYVRNLATGKIKLVSKRAKRANAGSILPELSGNGAFVAFSTEATNLIAGGDANGGTTDVLRRGPLH